MASAAWTPTQVSELIPDTHTQGKEARLRAQEGRVTMAGETSSACPWKRPWNFWLYSPVPWGCKQILSQGPPQARFRVGGPPTV